MQADDPAAGPVPPGEERLRAVGAGQQEQAQVGQRLLHAVEVLGARAQDRDALVAQVAPELGAAQPRPRRCGDDGGPARPGQPRLEDREVGARTGVVVDAVLGPDLEEPCRAAQEGGRRLVPDGRGAQAAVGPARAVGGVDHDVGGLVGDRAALGRRQALRVLRVDPGADAVEIDGVDIGPVEPCRRRRSW